MAGEMAVRIGQKIRKRRMEMGLNQRELAALIREHLGDAAVDGQRVSDWERAINKPGERYLRALAHVMERDYGWFYENETTETPDIFASEVQVEGIREHFDEKVERTLEIQAANTAELAGIRELLGQVVEELRRVNLDIDAQNSNLSAQSAILNRIESALGITPPTREPAVEPIAPLEVEPLSREGREPGRGTPGRAGSEGA